MIFDELDMPRELPLHSFSPTGVVLVRYRDVTFQTVKGCISDHSTEMERLWEAEMRGKQVQLFTPPIPSEFINEGFLYVHGIEVLTARVYFVGPAPRCTSGCNGPFFGIVGFEGSVCRHLVDIGD